MSISVKLKEVAKPKFNVGDVVKKKDGTIEPFEVAKIEVLKSGIFYHRGDGYFIPEKHLELHEEKLTFGDVPERSMFITEENTICLKVYQKTNGFSTLEFKSDGSLALRWFKDDMPIQRIIPKTEIREVE